MRREEHFCNCLPRGGTYLNTSQSSRRLWDCGAAVVVLVVGVSVVLVAVLLVVCLSSSATVLPLATGDAVIYTMPSLGPNNDEESHWASFSVVLGGTRLGCYQPCLLLTEKEGEASPRGEAVMGEHEMNGKRIQETESLVCCLSLILSLSY